jgi:hypothetical protein
MNRIIGAGVVVVAWYDRRESSDNMGWRIRAAASLDGGVTTIRFRSNLYWPAWKP